MRTALALLVVLISATSAGTALILAAALYAT